MQGLSLVVGRNYKLSFLFVNVIYSKQSSGEGSGLSEGYKEGLVDLSLRLYKNSAKEQYQTPEREDKCGYKLKFNFHILVVGR